MSNDDSTNSGASFGPVLIGIAAFFAVFAKDIPAEGLAKSDPGPRAWPLYLTACLLVVGIGYTLAWNRRQRTKKPAKQPLSAYWTDGGLHNVLLIVVGLVLFVFVLPYLGFVITATLFCTAVMSRLGHPAVADALRRRNDNGEMEFWKSALLTVAIAVAISIALIAVVVVLFDRVFNSPLPKSDLLNLPF